MHGTPSALNECIGGHMKTVYVIQDWAGNVMFDGQEFKSFEDAWDFLLDQVYKRLGLDGAIDLTKEQERILDEELGEYGVVCDRRRDGKE